MGRIRSDKIRIEKNRRAKERRHGDVSRGGIVTRSRAMEKISRAGIRVALI